MPLDLVETLCQLIALPSVNPMGRAADGPEFFEHRVTDFLEAQFRQLGLPYLRQNVEPQRDNIVVRLDGATLPEQGGRLVLLEAHQDTVPTTGMTIDPFRPVVADGRVYGRGACDIKGGLAAMLVAVARLAAEKPAERPTIVLAATVNEEHGFSGANALARLWSTPGTIFPRRPDAAIVAEPTELNVVVAHKGCVRWRCHTRGRATHSSQPLCGDNAIYRMAPVLKALEKYQSEVVPTLPVHPRCGPATLSVGTIQGGLSVNTVPDRCTIEIDRRIVPGEQPSAAREHVMAFLRSELSDGWPIEHDEPFLWGPGLPDRDNQALGASVAAAARRCHDEAQCIGVPFGTNAAVFAAAGVPTVVFGPGSLQQAHTVDEWLAIDQLERASEVLYRWCRSEYDAS